MTTHTRQLRLLPWSDSLGRPCYLSASDGRGMVSRLANKVEAEQLDNGDQFVAYTRELLGYGEVSTEDLHYLVNGLAESLHNALRIARSRGDLLDIAVDEEDDDIEEDEDLDPLDDEDPDQDVPSSVPNTAAGQRT